MEIDFVQLMTNKSEEELQVYIDSRQKYNPQAVFAAIDELKKRGKVFTDTELETIKNDISQQQEINKERIDVAEQWSPRWYKNVVDDIVAPQYYSQRTIYGFTIVFGSLFGAILMAINLSNAQKKIGTISVLLFGIVYTGIQFWLPTLIVNKGDLKLTNPNQGLTLITNIGCALIINFYFWNSFIGKETKYRAKPILIPLIIAICITIPLIYLIIEYRQR